MKRSDGALILATLFAFALAAEQWKDGRAKSAAIAVAEQQRDAADARADIADTRYAEERVRTARVDTVTRRALARVDTFWLEHPVDSAGWDSATVEQYQTEVSHAMRSCRLLMGAATALRTTCDAALVAKDSQIAARDGVVVALKRNQPTFAQRHWKSLAVGGFVLGAWLNK